MLQDSLKGAEEQCRPVSIRHNAIKELLSTYMLGRLGIQLALEEWNGKLNFLRAVGLHAEWESWRRERWRQTAPYLSAPVFLSLLYSPPSFTPWRERKRECVRERANEPHRQTAEQIFSLSFPHSCCPTHFTVVLCPINLREAEMAAGLLSVSFLTAPGHTQISLCFAVSLSLSLFLSLSLARLRAMQYKPPPGPADAPTLFMILIQDAVGSFHITWPDFSSWTQVNCETRECSL